MHGATLKIKDKSILFKTQTEVNFL